MTEKGAVEQGLSHLLYFSRARAETTKNMAIEFPEILSVAQRRNAELEITGGLLACGGWFVQILEGPHSNVNGAFDRICRDQRHEDVQVVKNASAAERFFPLWSMCGQDLSPTDDEIVAALEGGSVFDPRRMAPDTSAALLRRIQDLQSKHRGDGYTLID
jgi:Sensors of blue-light using FAD